MPFLPGLCISLPTAAAAAAADAADAPPPPPQLVLSCDSAGRVAAWDVGDGDGGGGGGALAPAAEATVAAGQHPLYACGAVLWRPRPGPAGGAAGGGGRWAVAVAVGLGVVEEGGTVEGAVRLCRGGGGGP